MDALSQLDPDRFFHLKTPGAHEWWYFDAISDDGRDVLVIIYYAGLPFDPSYGVAAIRHVKNPSKYPCPNALDHSAVGLSWHRDGKLMAYALSGHKADAFHHRADPFEIQVGTSRVARDPDGTYRLTVLTPSVEGKPIRASIRFQPAAKTEPFERNLGSPESPHHWILAAPDCRVEGSAAIGDTAMNFEGRGYHDHNAGGVEMSLAMRRWEWGRVHFLDRTQIYYASIPRSGKGEPQSLWITYRGGRLEEVHEVTPEATQESDQKRSVFGIRHAASRTVKEVGGADALGARSPITRTTGHCLDDGPFYRRWAAGYSRTEAIAEHRIAGLQMLGIAELLDTRHMNRFYFNWMIPYRLKWPRPEKL